MHCSSGPVVSSLLVQWSVVCCIHIRPCSIVNVILAPSEEAAARTVWSEALRLFRILKVAQNEAAEDWLTFNPLGGVAGPKAQVTTGGLQMLPAYSRKLLLSQRWTPGGNDHDLWPRKSCSLRVQDTQCDHQRSKPHNEYAEKQYDRHGDVAPPGAASCWLLDFTVGN
jgi:hypothetical protein